MFDVDEIGLGMETVTIKVIDDYMELLVVMEIEMVLVMLLVMVLEIMMEIMMEVNSKGCAETRPRDAEQLRLLDTNSIKSFSITLARGKLLIEPLLESDGLFASQQKTVNKGT